MSLFLDDAPYPSVPVKALSNSSAIANAPEHFGVCIVGARASIETASQFLNKVVATHFNGAPLQFEGTYFWPLAGRNVFISSCVEHESEISIQNLARKFWSAGVKNVFYLDLQITADIDILDGVQQRHSRSEITKVGWSDIVKGGWQPRTYVELYKSNASAKRSIPRSGEFDTSTTEQKAVPEPCDTDDEFTVEHFGSFIRTDAGIEKKVRTYGKTNESSKSSDVFVCSNLEIIGKANIDGLHQWGTVANFAAHDGRFQTIIVPDADLMGDGLPAREKLSAGGLKISTTRDARGFFLNLSCFILVQRSTKSSHSLDDRHAR